MHQAYLLLRGNQQFGPLSLPDLLRFNLTPYDLVWIEGVSAGWYYPQEIEALRPHLSFLQTAAPAPPASAAQPLAPRSIFVARPASPQRPEPMPTVAPTNPLPDGPAPTLFSERPETVPPPMPATEALPTKQMPFPKKAVAGGSLSALCLLGWLWLKPPAEPPASETKLPLVAQTVAANPLPDPVQPIEPAPANKPVRMAKTSTGKPVAARPSNQTPPRPAISAKETPAGKPDPLPEPAEVLPPASEAAPEPAPTAPPAEKKKLREKIADLFRKKPAEKEGPAPVEEVDGTRQSTRREAGSSLVQLVAVRFSVPNDWMLGIKGAKATLTNRSSETLARASVQVVYYNDENEVLDKRTLQFSNVKSKSSQTVSVPDHSTATRLEYVVLSATAAGEPVARK